MWLDTEANLFPEGLRHKQHSAGSSMMNEPFSLPQHIVGTQRMSRRQPQQTHVGCGAAMAVAEDLPQTNHAYVPVGEHEWPSCQALLDPPGKGWGTEEEGLNLSDSRKG